jgi:flavin reductase (DIM6/NTAB) family NADH-FMN oxidoreductase RutF
MDPNVKKTTLRMIPYGLYVLTAASKDGRISAGTVNFVTQASFEPPLVVVGVKTDSAGHALIKETKAFALNVLGKGQQALAFTFFKPAEKKGDTISGEPYRPGTTGRADPYQHAGVHRVLARVDRRDGRSLRLRRQGRRGRPRQDDRRAARRRDPLDEGSGR